MMCAHSLPDKDGPCPRHDGGWHAIGWMEWRDLRLDRSLHDRERYPTWERSQRHNKTNCSVVTPCWVSWPSRSTFPTRSCKSRQRRQAYRCEPYAATTPVFGARGLPDLRPVDAQTRERLTYSVLTWPSSLKTCDSPTATRVFASSMNWPVSMQPRLEKGLLASGRCVRSVHRFRLLYGCWLMGAKK